MQILSGTTSLYIKTEPIFILKLVIEIIEKLVLIILGYVGET